MNVLVTGAKGFIGSNLLKRLITMKDINLIEYNRHNTLQELESVIETIDFIYHFAGEVRPQSSDEVFVQSNADLTKDIITIIEKHDKKIPFLMTSSIHAELQKNAYGISKRAAEIYLETYGKQNHVPVWIYRLPHIFGEGCKPNYNSVISTWIYNSIHGKEIVVFDRNIPMTYSYVQDIVDEFVACLETTQNNTVSCYVKPKISYNTTLGDVVDFIEEFAMLQKNSTPSYTDFKAKLFATYSNYLNTKQ